MDTSELIRNKKYVIDSFIKSGGMQIATKLTKYYVPTRYEEKKLVSIGTTNFICGVCGIVVEDKYYAASLAATMIEIDPDYITTVKIDDVSYYEFTFNPGSVIHPNLNVVQSGDVIFTIYDMFIAGGNIPWYIDLDNIPSIFRRGKEFSGSNIGFGSAAIELKIGVLARSPDDISEYYCHYVNRVGKDKAKPPQYIGNRNAVFGATNTLSRMIGNYHDHSIAASLNNPTQDVEDIEYILRL